MRIACHAIAFGALAALLGCAGKGAGAGGSPATSAADGGSGTGGGSGAGDGSAAVASGGTGAAQGVAGTGGASGGAGSAAGGMGASPGTGGGAQAGSPGGAVDGGGVAGSGGTGGAAAGTGGSTAAAQTCANPSHVLPLNPQNPQDGITLGGFYVDTDTWNAAGYQVSQTMYICDYDDWYVIANMDDSAHDGAVKTYPNVHQDFNAAPLISSFGTISSSFAHTGPHVGIYEFAYDIWLNGVAGSGSTEVMIWTDNYNQVPSGSALDSVTYDGQGYDVYKLGSYIAFVATQNRSSGTLNLLSFFDYVIAKGWIASTSTLGAIDYGGELVSTDGMDATFAVTGFSLVAN